VSALLEVRGVTVRFGGVTAAHDVSFDVREGTVTALIGPNGAGKTTILNCISGIYAPTAGEIRLDDERISRMRPYRIARRGLARTFQAAALFGGMTALDTLMLGRYVHGRAGVLRSVLLTPGARRDEAVQRVRAEEILELLDMQAYRDELVRDLPYGRQKLLDFGRAVAQTPRLLLLDEPMAGMNAEEKADLAELIEDVRSHFGITLVLIEHDMGVVMSLADHVVVLNFGERIAAGSPVEVQRDPAVIAAYLGTETRQTASAVSTV
jgi:branched-chain amino acid transport system ATP-binding protein